MNEEQIRAIIQKELQNNFIRDEHIRQIIREELDYFIKKDKFIFNKHIQIMDGKDIQMGKTNGTMIGTVGGASGQKIGLWGTTPIVQPAAPGVSGADGLAIVASLKTIGIFRP